MIVCRISAAHAIRRQKYCGDKKAEDTAEVKKAEDTAARKNRKRRCKENAEGIAVKMKARIL